MSEWRKAWEALVYAAKNPLPGTSYVEGGGEAILAMDSHVRELEAENKRLKEAVERLRERIKWYTDYANMKDKDVSEEIARCNEAEAENKRLKEAVEWALEVIDDRDYMIHPNGTTTKLIDELRRRAGME